MPLPACLAPPPCSARDPATATKAYDGGVLEIKIGTGAFTDILSAGGSFVSGGYNNKTIDSTDDNPLDGRQLVAQWSAGVHIAVCTTKIACIR